MSENTTNMRLIGIKVDVFYSLLNIWMIGEGFHAYLHTMKIIIYVTSWGFRYILAYWQTGINSCN